MKAAKRARYREDALCAAEALFAEHGVDGTRIEAIAARAGIAPRTLYSVFDSKQALVHAVSERHRDALTALGREAIVSAADPWLALEGALQTSTRYFLGHPMHLRHELREARFWADERASESGTWAVAFAAYSRLFDRAMTQGLARPGDATASARALLALQQSQLAHWIATGMTDPADRVTQSLTDLVRHAFAVGAGALPELNSPAKKESQ